MVSCSMKKVRDFRFKKFTVLQEGATHKVGTDGVLLGAWVDVTGTTRILDIGTGSGVIALMLAQRTEDISIDAVEIQSQDAQQARENFLASPWPDRLSVHECAIQDFRTENRYDLIVSNPPFFVNSWLPPKEQRSIVRHTDTLSFEALLTCVKRLLSSIPGSRFATVLPFVEGNQFIELATTFGLYCIRRCEFKSREHKPVERLLLEFSRKLDSTIHETLTLYKEGEEWSEAYKTLTRSFYLKL
jgi:tRNA1Val (adenine37-N6)-methyltransferase